MIVLECFHVRVLGFAILVLDGNELKRDPVLSTRAIPSAGHLGLGTGHIRKGRKQGKLEAKKENFNPVFLTECGQHFRIQYQLKLSSHL